MPNFTVKFIKDNGSNKTPTIETFKNKTLTQLRNLFNKRQGMPAKLFVNNKKYRVNQDGYKYFQILRVGKTADIMIARVHEYDIQILTDDTLEIDMISAILPSLIAADKKRREIV